MDAGIEINDQIGRKVALLNPAKKIVSLVPSQTLLLADLDLDSEVVGITKFCVHPHEWRKKKTIIGGTKKIHHEKIHDLQPDLIIANKEENNREDIEALEQHYQVYVSEVEDLESSIRMIEDIGRMTGKLESAKKINEEIIRGFSKLKVSKKPESILYFIWKNPWMVAGNDTFISAMIEKCGWKNAAQQARYPTVTEADIQEINPEIVFLSSEPFPFKQKHIQELQNLLPQARIELVDGEMFSWYGSALVRSAAYFSNLIR
ncbi:MAG: cobalamin-binding protein [Flavobacteriales bacterium]|nr:MAG: cobalamin-binding protein [Flavobacteriales bacterium]